MDFVWFFFWYFFRKVFYKIFNGIKSCQMVNLTCFDYSSLAFNIYFKAKTANSSLSIKFFFNHVHITKRIPFKLIICFYWFQFERDGFMVFDDFFSPVEIAEMLKAGRALCHQAPKEDRKVFSTTDPETSQVIFIIYDDQSRETNFFLFIFRIATNISSIQATKFAISSKLELLIRTMNFWYLRRLLSTKSDMLWLWNIRSSGNTLLIIELGSCAGNSAIKDQP